MSLSVSLPNTQYVKSEQNSKQIQQKQKQKKNIAGGLGALVVGSCIKKIGNRITGVTMLPKFTKYSEELTTDEVKIVGEGVKKVLNDITNLAKKGVQINDVREMEFCLEGNTFVDGFTRVYKAMILNPVAAGKNAFYTPELHKSGSFLRTIQDKIGIKKNSVAVNMQKLPLAAFHELGHAFNYNNSTFWKTMQKARGPLTCLASLVAIIPAFTKETKSQEGQELTKKEKFTNNLRKASPFIAGSMMLPVVAEELKATLRANKWTKDIFADIPKLAKKVSKTNLAGLTTYISAMVFVTLSSLAVKNIKDASDEKLSQKK